MRRFVRTEWAKRYGAFYGWLTDEEREELEEEFKFNERYKQAVFDEILNTMSD